MGRLLNALILLIGVVGRLAAEPAAVAPHAIAPSSATVQAPPGAVTMRLPAGTPEEIELGRHLYEEAVGSGGKPIVGIRFDGVETTGASAACVTCHRRSGLGAVEGNDQVPPVAGRFLFSDDPRALVSLNVRNLKSFNQRHEPYDLVSLAEALRHGKHVEGRELGPIMPRYELSDGEIKALAAYLRTLSVSWSPGVNPDRIRFATVITPEVDSTRRKVFIDTIQAAVGQRNGNVVAHGQRSMSAAEMYLQTERRWELDIWELQGPPDTWGQQLDAKLQAQPVFALISGLGEGTWLPVHEFCERQKIACWFPSVDLPPEKAAEDFFSLYFSRGVALEADVLTHHLQTIKPKRLVQIHGGDDAGRGGADALRRKLAAARSAIKVEDRVVKTADEAGIGQAFAKLGKADAVMLWLKPDVIARAGDRKIAAGNVYMSAYLANGEKVPLPAAWRSQIRMIYPFQLPDKRATGLMYFHAWLGIRKLPLVDEVMQSEVYFALTYLADTLMDMLDNVHREYLIERAENMLSLRESAKAEDEAREMSIAKHHLLGGNQAAAERLNQPEIRKIPRPIPGKVEHVMAKRESTTIYPRLGLGQKQRFASKGAYIVRFGDGQPPAVIAETEWIVP